MPRDRTGKHAHLDWSDDDDEEDVSLYSDYDSDGEPIEDHAPRPLPKPSRAAPQPAKQRQGRARSPKRAPVPRDARGKMRSVSPRARDSPNATPRGNAPEKRKDTYNEAYRSVMAVVGPAGAGKTSLLGYLCAVSPSATNLPLAAVEASAIEAGRPLAKFAWLLDRTLEERQSGTAAPREVAVPTSGGWIGEALAMDCPGGDLRELDGSLRVIARSSRVAVVLPVDSDEFEAGKMFFAGLLRGIRAMRVEEDALVFLINKMDSVDFSADAFMNIRERVAAAYEREMGKPLAKDKVVPMAAALGENVVALDSRVTGQLGNKTVVQALHGMSGTTSFDNFFTVDTVVSPSVVCGHGKAPINGVVLPLLTSVVVKEVREIETGILCTTAGAARRKLTLDPPCHSIFPGCVLAPPRQSVMGPFGYSMWLFSKARVLITTLWSNKTILADFGSLTIRIHNFEGPVRLVAVTRVCNKNGNWGKCKFGTALAPFSDAEVILQSLGCAVPYRMVGDRNSGFTRDDFYSRIFLYDHKQLVGVGVVVENVVD